MHLRAITATYAKTKTLPQALASHYRDICQVKKPVPQAPASHCRDICQDKNLTTSTCAPLPRHLPRQKPYHKPPRAIAVTFAKTKTLPQAPASSLPRTFAKTKTLPQAPACPLPRHLPRQKPCRKHLRAITATFAKTKTLPQAPASHYRDICQDKNLTTSTCEPLRRHLPRQKPYRKPLRAITATFAKTKT